MSTETVKELRWTTIALQPDGTYSKVVTKEQHHWLTRQWMDDLMTVAEDLDAWYSPFRATEDAS